MCFHGLYSPSKLVLVFKEIICSYRSKFCPSRVDPTEKGGKKKMTPYDTVTKSQSTCSSFKKIIG